MASGDYMIICDADLEYAPEDIPGLVQPVLDGEATVVYGTRTFSSNSAFSFWYVMGNRAVTLAANVLFNSYISDLETCFKLLPLELYRELDITSAGFGMEAQLTARLLARGHPALRGPDPLQGPQPRGRQEADVEGRGRGAGHPLPGTRPGRPGRSGRRSPDAERPGGVGTRARRSFAATLRGLGPTSTRPSASLLSLAAVFALVNHTVFPALLGRP